jgi:NDP-sugar pyrophosphorylase family protein
MVGQAFVLGAGLGTRLRPLTDELPKPLVPVFGKPLITFALDHLAAAGVERFIINTHHLPQAFEKVFPGRSYLGRKVILLHEPDLLETGGGLKNAQSLLGDKPFFVYSGDVLTDLPLAPLLEEHLRRQNDVTLALRDTGLAREMAFRDGRVTDIGHLHGHPGELDFANVSIWNPSAFDLFSLGEKVSFIPVLGKWIGQGGKIGGVIIEEGEWFNLGSPAQYLDVHAAIAQKNWRPEYLRPNEWPVRVAADAQVDPGAEIRGYSAVGAGCSIGAGAVIDDSILWSGVQISPRTQLKRCIVRAGRAIAGAQTDVIV